MSSVNVIDLPPDLAAWLAEQRCKAAVFREQGADFTAMMIEHYADQFVKATRPASAEAPE